MIILGIDPGVSVTGYGVIEVDGNCARCIDYGSISTRGQKQLSLRLEIIFDGLNRVIETYQPQFCAIENIFYSDNVKTAIVMGHARGVAMLAAQKHSVRVYEYSPREVKMSIAGMGAASKKQVSAMVKTILQLKEEPHPIDAADALAVALCHHHRIKINSVLQGVDGK